MAFSENSYYEIYAHFIMTKTNYIFASYFDTATLNNFWKSHVARAGSNDNIKWIIRDGDNRQNDPKTGNYYYFDKNSDIVYVHQTDNNKYNIKVKEFVGGLIVKYNQDNTGASSQVWTIGGLYKTVTLKDNKVMANIITKTLTSLWEHRIIEEKEIYLLSLWMSVMPQLTADINSNLATNLDQTNITAQRIITIENIRHIS